MKPYNYIHGLRNLVKPEKTHIPEMVANPEMIKDISCRLTVEKSWRVDEETNMQKIATSLSSSKHNTRVQNILPYLRGLVNPKVH